jgi:hypothetical protein
VFDSVINFNGHIKAVSKALEDSKNKGQSADAAAASSQQ